MSISNESLRLFFYLIPGFLSSILLGALVYRKEQTAFKFIITSLIFTFLIYSLPVIFLGYIPLPLAIDTDSFTISLDRKSLAVIFGISVSLPVVLAFLINNDLIFSFLRWIHITYRTSRENVWLDVFASEKKYIIVHLQDGTRVFGWPARFSDTPEEGYLYLQDPSWINEDDEYEDMDIHGFFLVKKENIEYIQFTDISVETAKMDTQNENETY